MATYYGSNMMNPFANLPDGAVAGAGAPLTSGTMPPRAMAPNIAALRASLPAPGAAARAATDYFNRQRTMGQDALAQQAARAQASMPAPVAAAQPPQAPAMGQGNFLGGVDWQTAQAMRRAQLGLGPWTPPPTSVPPPLPPIFDPFDPLHWAGTQQGGGGSSAGPGTAGGPGGESVGGSEGT